MKLFKYISLSVSILLMSMSGFTQVYMNVYLNDGTVIEVPAADIDSISYANSNPGGPVLLSLSNELAYGFSAGVFFVDILSGGGSDITNKGICWSQEQEPTTADGFVEMGPGAGSFEIMISGLEPSSTYYVRAYSVNTAGTTYSNQKTLYTLPLFDYANMELGLIGNGLNYNGVQHTWNDGETILLSLPELIDEHYTWTFDGVETNTEPGAGFKIREGQDWNGYNIGFPEALITGSLASEVSGDFINFTGTVDGAIYDLILMIHQETGIPTLVVEPG